MRGLFKKVAGVLVPDDEETTDRVYKLPAGVPLLGEIKTARNGQLLKKAHALVRLAFGFHSDTMEEGVMYRGVPVLPDIERFREDLTILAGWYTATFAVNGEVRLRARSWAYCNMEEGEFQRLYSALIDACLRKVYRDGRSEAQLQKMVNEVLSFA